MITLKSFILVGLVICSCLIFGCLNVDESKSVEHNTNNQTSTNILETIDIHYNKEDSNQNNRSNKYNYSCINTTLHRNEILFLKGEYALTINYIDYFEQYVTLSSLYKGDSYSTHFLYTNEIYEIKDSNYEHTIYIIGLDKIYPDETAVDITYAILPNIYQDFDSAEHRLTNIPAIKLSHDQMTRNYEWNYKSQPFLLQATYNHADYMFYSERSRQRTWVHFVKDPYHSDFIAQLSEQLELLAYNHGYERDEIPYIAISFVQSLPYISDSVSKGYDQYARFPFETMYYGGGDCEDSSILLAAILNNLGYDVALIELPGHIAVGIHDNEGIFHGSYYEHEGKKYFYLETTNSGWKPGEIPEEFKDSKAIIYPIEHGYPEIGVGFSWTVESYRHKSYVDIDIDIENVGSETANNVVIYTTLESIEDGMVWNHITSNTIETVKVDEKIKYSVSNLTFPSTETTRIGIWISGSNMGTRYVYSDWFSLRT